MKAENNITAEIKPVIFGKPYDSQGDLILSTFECLDCNITEAELFTYDEIQGLVAINPLVDYGTYYFRVTLKDNNQDP